MPRANGRPTPAPPSGSADVWEVLERLGVDPAEHFARLLRDDSEADEKRKDEAARQLLPYCYARKGTQAPTVEEGRLVGQVLCGS